MALKRKNIGGLERKLLAYFLLIAVAALMIGIEFVIEMNSVHLKEELWDTMSGPVRTEDFSPDSGAFGPINKLRNKIIIMFGVLTVVVAIVLIMFVRNITTPLQRMANVAKRINAGDLSQVVPVTTSDEIGDLGSAINELTSNLQEVAAHVEMIGNDAVGKLTYLKSVIENIKNEKSSKKRDEMIKDLLGRIDDIEWEVNSLKDIAESFKFLETEIKDNKEKL